MKHLSFSNVVAALALFIALGGTAWALANDSVKSRHIDNGQVKTEDLDGSAVTGGKIGEGAVNSSDVADDSLTTDDVGDGSLTGTDIEDGALTGTDVDDGSLTGDEVAFNSLDGVDIDEESLDPEELPPTASLAAQIRNIGAGGDIRYGGVSGLTTASTDMTEVQMLGGMRVAAEIQVWMEHPPVAGESRTFTLVRRGDPDGAILDTAIGCTLLPLQRYCSDTAVVTANAQLLAVEIQSSGAGLSSTDDAYVGLMVGG